MEAQKDFSWTFLQILRNLLTNPRSLQAGIIIFAGLFLADLLFRSFFKTFSDFLEGGDTEILWAEIDVGFAPILWLVFITLILGSLTIVISFAAEKVPKLIDLYMDHWPSLFFVWFTIALYVHALTIKLMAEMQMDVRPSLILNYNILLPLFMIIGFPFILSILYSTKTGKVIEQLFGSIQQVYLKLASIGPTGDLHPKKRLKWQIHLFETTNQLIDLLVYVPYKEPKAQIIEGLGDLLIEYLKWKKDFPVSFFEVTEDIREDISFKTLKGQFEDIEKDRVFYELKNFRVIGNAFISFIEAGEFDLSTLCVDQVQRIGVQAVELKHDKMMDLVLIHLNTHLRFALKHGRFNNEPRNLYNLIFHYGKFVQSLIEQRDLPRVKTSYGHYLFYGQAIFEALLDAPSLAFILDTLATEMKKGLIKMYELHWDREHYFEQLKQFLLLDNLQNIDRSFAFNFFSKNHGIRLLHIGMALFFLENNEEEWARLIAKDTMQDYDLLGKETFHKTMNTIYARLQFSGPTFWEDTDRGNVNIYYSPHQNQINVFREIQNEYVGMQPKPAKVI